MNLERKIKGSSETENVFKDSVRKENLNRLNWSKNWNWFIDLIRERKKAVDCYRKSGPKATICPPVEEVDKRSVLPFPVTTSQDYGWLSTKKEFELEVFGSYYQAQKSPSTAGDTVSSIFYSTSDL